MATSLRPLSVGEILDAGIKVFTRHWKPLAGTVAIITGPVFVVYVLLIASIDAELLSISASFGSTRTTTEDPTTTELVGFALSWLLQDVPLRTTAGADAPVGGARPDIAA